MEYEFFFQHYGQKAVKPKDEFVQAHNEYFANETKSQQYYSNLSEIYKRFLLCNKFINKDRTFMVEFYKMFLESISNEKYDKNTEFIDSNDYIKICEDINTLMKYSEKEDYKLIFEHTKALLNLCEQHRTFVEKYSYDVAFNYLNNKNIDSYNIFLKTVLVSDDYFNANKLYELRNLILTSNHLEKQDRLLFCQDKIDKTLSSMFFADYKLIQLVIYILKYFDKYRNNATYINILIYGRFIIFAMAQLYTNRHIFGEFEYYVPLILNKIYNKIDLLIFNIAKDLFDDIEIMYLIMSKLLGEASIHEELKIGSVHIKNSIKFQKKFERFVAGCIHDNIIEEMADVALKEWKNLNTLSHIQMIEFLKKTDRFAEALKERGVERNLKKRLKQICRDNNFPYIEGEDMFTGAGRKKSSSKNNEKPK